MSHSPCDSQTVYAVDDTVEGEVSASLSPCSSVRRYDDDQGDTADKRVVPLPINSCPSPSNPFLCPFYRVVTDGSRRTAQVRIDQLSAKICERLKLQNSVCTPLSMKRFSLGELSIYTDIGGRKAQEDRFIFYPALQNRHDCCLVGVFDGTVGDFASDHVKDYVVPHLVSSLSWAKVIRILEKQDDERRRVSPVIARAGSSAPEFNLISTCDETVTSCVFPVLAEAIDEMYLRSDSELVACCAEAGKHYASSTSVVAVLTGGCCGIGHLGDSRAALGHFGGDQLYANFITDDHKPNQFYERSRIKASGGSVEYLYNHNNKPFIRGGDFTARKHKGEQPMQLQYSRAFGGKDLKGYGLSNEPDILCFRVEPFHSCLILASDGLWDVMNATSAVHIAVRSRLSGCDPAKALVHAVLEEQTVRRQIPDNITSIVLFFNTAVS